MVEIETLFSLIGFVLIEFSETIIFYISHCCDMRPNSTFSPASHDLISSARAQGSSSITSDQNIQTDLLLGRRNLNLSFGQRKQNSQSDVFTFHTSQQNTPLSNNFLHCCSVLFIQQTFEGCLCQALSGQSDAKMNVTGPVLKYHQLV